DLVRPSREGRLVIRLPALEPQPAQRRAHCQARAGAEQEAAPRDAATAGIAVKVLHGRRLLISSICRRIVPVPAPDFPQEKSRIPSSCHLKATSLSEAPSSRSTCTWLFWPTAQMSLRLGSYIRPIELLKLPLAMGSTPGNSAATQRFFAQS